MTFFLRPQPVHFGPSHHSDPFGPFTHYGPFSPFGPFTHYGPFGPFDPFCHHGPFSPFDPFCQYHPHHHHHHHHCPPYTCFLPGTLIRMADGSEKSVETIVPGDAVRALVDGETVSRKVVWAGAQEIQVRPALSDDEAQFPVLVRRNAISEGLPARDLRITPEHCLFIEGRFIPVRMLVNGGSIAYDRNVTSYTFHHIEAERHSVIFAEDMPTESYLDTGNRVAFSTDGNVHVMGRAMSWDDAAAPLETGREMVEPIYRRLAARSAELGLEVSFSPATTEDAGLHLLTPRGEILRPVRHVGSMAVFMLPSGVETVRMISRASRPADAVGPFCDDRRELGVLVGDVTLWDAERTRTIEAHLKDGDLAGWHALEAPDMRWTDGAAILPLGKRQVGQLALLHVEVRAAGPYVLEERAKDALTA